MFGSMTPLRTRFPKLIALLLAAMCLFGALPTFGQEQKDEFFSLIVLPDTQGYSAKYPDIFTSQTQWIKDHRKDLKIAFVVHEGDITNTNTEKEWQNADKSMSILDGVVPYSLAVGNHDMGAGGKARDRDTALFNKYFPVSRYEKQPWYGGHFEQNNDNSYQFFTAQDMKFLVVNLEFGPRDEVLDWANQLVAKHPDHRIIVVTHCYMNHDDTRVGEGDKHNPHLYGCKGNDGEEIWDKFVRKHKNIFLVLSGHILGDGLGRLTSKGDHGNEVHQLLANYQMRLKGGNGMLRVMKFVPKENLIQVTTYSPFLKQDFADEDNQFSLKYDMARKN